jgi:hypothetical protein
VTWQRIEGLIPDARADIRPTYLYQFERLVTEHQAYRKRTIEAARRAVPRPASARAGSARKRGR